MEASIEQKQHFLRAQILDSGVDPQGFMEYMGQVKDQGTAIKLENWSLQELKNVVRTYKQQINEDMKKIQDTEIIIPNSQIMRSIILDNKTSQQAKVKVHYNRGLWDYQMKSKQMCKKIKQRVDISKVKPQIGYNKWQIKKSGGFLFGFGAKDELWIETMTNFIPHKVLRKSEDFDWLRRTLSKRCIGSYVPPLEEYYTIQPEDKVGIGNRVRSIMSFMNSLTDFDYLLQNRYVWEFLSEADYKKFSTFCLKENDSHFVRQLGSAETVDGSFTAEISKRTMEMTTSASKFASDSEIIYESFEVSLTKILSDMETLSKHSLYVANDFARMHDSFNRLADKTTIYTGNMSTMLVYFNNLFNSMQKNLKTQIYQLKEILYDFAKVTHKEWKEFATLDKKREYEFNQYLDFKENLLKRKQKCLKEPSQWELTEIERVRINTLPVDKMPKEDVFALMFPKANEQEEEKRVWLGFLNFKYEKSLNLLIASQEKRYIQQFRKYEERMRKLMQDQINALQQFYPIVLPDGKAP